MEKCLYCVEILSGTPLADRVHIRQVKAVKMETRFLKILYAIRPQEGHKNTRGTHEAKLAESKSDPIHLYPDSARTACQLNFLPIYNPSFTILPLYGSGNPGPYVFLISAVSLRRHLPTPGNFGQEQFRESACEGAMSGKYVAPWAVIPGAYKNNTHFATV